MCFLEGFIKKVFIGFFFGFVRYSFICIQFFCVIFCLQVFLKTFILKFFLSFCFMKAMCFQVFLLCANFLLKCIFFTLLSSPIEAHVGAHNATSSLSFFQIFFFLLIIIFHCFLFCLFYKCLA